MAASGLLDFIENVDPIFINQNFENLQTVCFRVKLKKIYIKFKKLRQQILEESIKISSQKKAVMILASISDIHFQIDKELSAKETSKISIIKFKKKKSNLTIDPNELKTKDKISEILSFIAFNVLKCF